MSLMKELCFLPPRRIHNCDSFIFPEYHSNVTMPSVLTTNPVRSGLAAASPQHGRSDSGDGSPYVRLWAQLLAAPPASGAGLQSPPTLSPADLAVRVSDADLLRVPVPRPDPLLVHSLGAKRTAFEKASAWFAALIVIGLLIQSEVTDIANSYTFPIQSCAYTDAAAGATLRSCADAIMADCALPRDFLYMATPSGFAKAVFVCCFLFAAVVLCAIVFWVRNFTAVSARALTYHVYLGRRMAQFNLFLLLVFFLAIMYIIFKAGLIFYDRNSVDFPSSFVATCPRGPSVQAFLNVRQKLSLSFSDNASSLQAAFLLLFAVVSGPLLNAWAGFYDFLGDFSPRVLLRCTDDDCTFHNISAAHPDHYPIATPVDAFATRVVTPIWNTVRSRSSVVPRARLGTQRALMLGEGKSAAQSWPLFVSSFVRLQNMQLMNEYLCVRTELEPLAVRDLPLSVNDLSDYEFGLLLAHVAWLNARKHRTDMRELAARLARASYGFYGPAGGEFRALKVDQIEV